jgi:hypothetical protein
LEPERGKCQMCGSTFLYEKQLPPCTITFLGKQFKADLCYVCGARIAEFVKSYRKKKSWSQYTT